MWQSTLLWFRHYGFPALFVWIFLFAGLAMLGWGLWGALEAYQSRTWPVVPGTITRSDISTSTFDSDVMFSAEIRYVYTVDSQEMRGSRVSFSDLSSSDARRAERVITRYLAGSSVQVYYNPRDPLDTVLEPGFTPGLLLPLGLGAGFTLAGGGMTLGMIHRLSGGRAWDGE